MLPNPTITKRPGKVAIFATCYINYNEPAIGHDLLTILAHNAVPYRIVEQEACCGMPKLELGDLESVARLKAINVPPLAALARSGHAILTAVPSCTLMFKHELAHFSRRSGQGDRRRDVRSVRVPVSRQGRSPSARSRRCSAR
jgi:Fe-S oxidoreductase